MLTAEQAGVLHVTRSHESLVGAADWRAVIAEEPGQLARPLDHQAGQGHPAQGPGPEGPAVRSL